MKVAAIIPARLKSSRFPAKPLAPILGRPMILWVADLTAKAVGSEMTFVATDDEQIRKIVTEAGHQAVMTPENCLTGTDRIAAAMHQIEADLFINVQGDEPMLDPNSILKVVEAAQRHPGEIINGYAPLSAEEDPHDVNIPKCVLSSDGRLLYMSRLAVPGFKDEACRPGTYHKQVCIYAFCREHLEAFNSRTSKAPCEKAEDIEILRFLDMGYTVRMVELPSDTIAVDRPEDIALVEAALQAAE